MTHNQFMDILSQFTNICDFRCCFSQGSLTATLTKKQTTLQFKNLENIYKNY